MPLLVHETNVRSSEMAKEGNLGFYEADSAVNTERFYAALAVHRFIVILMQFVSIWAFWSLPDYIWSPDIGEDSKRIHPVQKLLSLSLSVPPYLPMYQRLRINLITQEIK